jgi:hypothetical protein
MNAATNRICKACGGAKPADKFRACTDCRRKWREAGRVPGDNLDCADALERLVAGIDGIKARGAFYPTGFPEVQAALARAKSALAARRRRP